MKKLALVVALPLLSMLGCGSKKEDATPAPSGPSTPTAPASSFMAAAGTFTIKPVTGASYVLSNLKLKVAGEQDASGALTTYIYTFRGITPTNTGIEVEARFMLLTSVAQGKGPWSTNVYTRSTDANFAQIKDLDLTGGGTLTAISNGYTLTYTAKSLSGSLVQ